jgi:hypothetical protein
MKVIESSMVRAIRAKKDFKNSNTRVTFFDGVARVYLFNNLIATCDSITGDIEVFTRYKSQTTKSRLNAILGEFCNTRIYAKDFVWYYSQTNEPCYENKVFKKEL